MCISICWEGVPCVASHNVPCLCMRQAGSHGGVDASGEVLPADRLNELLDPRRMSEPGLTAGPVGGEVWG
jgi:hypothetical protein